MTSRYSLDRRLGDAGLARLRAEDERLAAAHLLHKTVREAAAQGWPKTKIARTAGISRQTVHEILKP